MSSILPHDGFDSDDDFDDDYEINPDQVDYDYHDENDVHSNDPTDENDEFPTPAMMNGQPFWDGIQRWLALYGERPRMKSNPLPHGTGIFLPLPLLSHLVISKGNWKNCGLSSV